MNGEPTTGSLDTNVRLLAQRVTIMESDMKRLGDSMRLSSRDISKLEALTAKNDEMLGYRLEDINSKLKEMSEASKDFKRWLMGISSALVVTFLLSLFELFRQR